MSTTYTVIRVARLTLTVASLAVAVAGTFGTQFSTNDNTTDVYLFQIDIGGTKTKYTNYNFVCATQERLFKAALSFGIVGWIGCLAGVILSIPTFFFDYDYDRMKVGFVRVFVALLSSISLLVSWAISAALFSETYCGSKLGSSAKYGYGFGLLVTAWVLTIIWLTLEIFNGVLHAASTQTC